MAKANSTKAEFGRGLARFLTLGKSETYQGKPTGKQVASIILKGEALDEANRIVDSFIEDNFTPKEIKAGVNRPFKTDNKTGDVYLKAAAYLETQDGDPITVPVANAKGKVVENPPQIGNGSVIRLRVVLRKTEFQGKSYINVGLRAVQVIKLVKYEGGGFAADEDADDEDAFTGDEFDSAPTPKGSKQVEDDLDDEIPF